MSTVSIREAKNRLTELARQVERGEPIVVTRNARPVFDLVPNRPMTGIQWEAIDAFTTRHGIAAIDPEIPGDFDELLPEDFLLTGLPPDP